MSWYPLEGFIDTSRGKNALKLAYLQKALGLINCELELLNLRIRYSQQFNQPNPSPFESDLYFVTNRKGLGIIAFAEIVIALFLTKQVFRKDGKPADLIQISNAFEKIFNFSFGSIYDQEVMIFRRKPFNRTKAIDFLRNLIIRKDKEIKK